MSHSRASRATRVDNNASYELPSHQIESMSMSMSFSPESKTPAIEVSPVYTAGARSNADQYDEYEQLSYSGLGVTLVDEDQGGQDKGHPEGPEAQKTTRWKIHWKGPSLILSFLVAGIAFALGHHFHYSALDGAVVSSEPRQEWALRFGTAFAFLAQSCLTASVGVAYAQRIWVTAKRKPLALRTLDSVFSLQSNIFSFLNWELLRKAKVLCLLGLVAWCIPISSTITPATLSVRTGIITNSTEANVPCPDYSNSSGVYWANFEGAGTLDGPSPAINRLVAATMTSISILPFDAPSPNSSYTLTFYGPAFRCQDLASAVAAADDDDRARSLNASNSGATTSLRDAWALTMDPQLSSKTLEPFLTAASPEDSFVVDRDDHLLFLNTNLHQDSSRNYSCRLWNTSYTVSFAFDDGIQSTTIQSLRHVAPAQKVRHALYTRLAPGQVQYQVFLEALVNTLTAQLGWGSTGSFVGQDSAVLTSGLPACPEVRAQLQGFSGLFPDWMCRAGSVPAAVEDLSHNVTLSLLSSEFLATETAADVTTRRPATFYTYNWRNLALAYAISVFAALVCAAVGVQALMVNGYSATASFSTILLTTRNEDLDHVARGHCLGESPMDKNLGRTMLRYGILKSQASDGSKVPHAAFGLSGDVRELRKREPCQ